MGPMGGGGSGGGGNANVYLPPGQGEAAGMLGNIANPLFNASMNAGAGTPGAWAYPQAQGYAPMGFNQVQQYLTGSQTGAPTLYDQGAGQAYGSAQNAADLYSQMFGNVYGQIPGLAGAATSGLQYLPQLMSSAFSPLYGGMVNAAADNPYYPQAMAGAQQGATLGGAGANSLYGAGQGILQQGFDPQSALFDRSQQQLLDQSNAVNAMSGIAGSPYAAGTTAKALGDFDINWQNQQLQRQATAAGAASPLFQAAPQLAYGSGQMPSQTYMSQIGNVLNALNAQGAAGSLGASAFPSLLSGAAGGLGQAQSLLGSSIGGLASSGLLPYQTGAGIANNALSGLNSQQNLLTGATGLGNNQYMLPQQMIGDLMKYMGLGQDASRIGANIGQMGFNQTAQGFGGLLSGANSLFNPKSGLFPGALGFLGL